MFHATSLNALSVHLAGRPSAVTIGVFDGIHLGHQALIRRTVDAARDSGMLSAVITFPDHPLALLAPPYQPHRLMTNARRSELLEAMGVDVLVEVPFDADFAATDPEVFIAQRLVAECRMQHMVCGFDFSFGQGGRGNVNLLRRLAAEYGFQLVVVDPIRDQEINIKSTHIRDVLFNGNVEDAARLLGRPFGLTGTVVTGRQQGRLIGFPTANIKSPPKFLIPAVGVYAGWVNDSSCEVPAMINIGNSPTFGDNPLTVEAHLIDWSGDLVGQELTVHLLRRIRNEQKFESVEKLIEQLNQDRAATLQTWQRHLCRQDKD